MVRCLTPLHIQGFALSCYTWVYVLSNDVFLQGWVNGGPSGVLYSWLVAAMGTSAVMLSLAEVSSACPHIGARGSPPQAYKGLAGFMTASCNILGVMTSLPYIIMQVAELLATIRYALTYDTMTGEGRLTASWEVTCIYLGICVSLGLLASAPSRVVAAYCSFGLFTNLILFFSLSCTLLLLAPTHPTPSFSIHNWRSHPDITGITDGMLSFLAACNMGVNTFSGYDAALYMTEECFRPTFALPAALWRGFVIVFALGGVSLLMVLFSVQHPDRLLSPDAVFGGQGPVAQILWDVMEARFQSGRASAPFLALTTWSLFLICMFLVIGTSRKVYAMSRYGLSTVRWPQRLATHLLQMGLGLTLLADDTQALFSVFCDASIPFTFCSYLIPIAIGLCTTEKLLPGPWDMGRWGPSVRTGAALFLLLTLFISMAPQSYPASLQTSYAPILWLAGLLAMLAMWYCPKAGGRHFYTGPSTRLNGVRFSVTAPTLRPTPRRSPRPPAASACMSSFQGMVAQRSPLHQPQHHQPQHHHHHHHPGRIYPAAATQSGTPPTPPGMGGAQPSGGPPLPAQTCLGWFSRALGTGPGRLLAHITAMGLSLTEWLPSGSGIRQKLRIPDEHEALDRARRSPTHPAGYAWDKKASLRLGHRQVPAGRRVSLHSV
ncbi:MAG: hypothetical protein WDW36_006644 [Sanguina aurantia]